MKKHRLSVTGFTLVELMVTLAVMVILGMMAAPALQSYVARSGVQTLQNDFVATMNRARGEALSRNTCVSVCQLHRSDKGVKTCEVNDADDGQWHLGWLMIENPSCAAIDNGHDMPADAVILEVREPGNPRFTLKMKDGVAAQDAFTYNARGQLQNQNINLIVADSKDPVGGGPYSRVLSVSGEGRVMASANPDYTVTTAAGTKK